MNINSYIIDRYQVVGITKGKGEGGRKLTRAGGREEGGWREGSTCEVVVEEAKVR